jgi:hypothetical protein
LRVRSSRGFACSASEGHATESLIWNRCARRAAARQAVRVSTAPQHVRTVKHRALL